MHAGWRSTRLRFKKAFGAIGGRSVFARAEERAHRGQPLPGGGLRGKWGLVSSVPRARFKRRKRASARRRKQLSRTKPAVQRHAHNQHKKRLRRDNQARSRLTRASKLLRSRLAEGIHLKLPTTALELALTSESRLLDVVILLCAALDAEELGGVEIQTRGELARIISRANRYLKNCTLHELAESSILSRALLSESERRALKDSIRPSPDKRRPRQRQVRVGMRPRARTTMGP